MGATPEILLPVLKAVVEATNLPVGFKLSPEVGYPRMLHLVEESVKIGIPCIVTTHKYFAVAPPDIWDHGKGKFPALEANCLADFGGSALRFSMYKATALVSKHFPQIDTFAGGGIVSPQHVVEAIMLGARYCSCCGMCNFICPVDAFNYVPRS